MSITLVRVGKHIVNIELIADAKWENDSLYVHFHGGSYATFRGQEAKLVWSVIETLTVNLDAPRSNA